MISMTKNNEIAFITFDHPPVNALSRDLLEKLSSMIDELEQDNSISCIIFNSQSEKYFVAGADIKEFQGWQEKGSSYVERQSLRLQQVFNKIMNMKKITIAAINGVTLGGGCELVLSCDLRIMEEQAIIGLPEIKLGLFPGAGGTQRLPRLIGESRAKEMMFTGKPIDGVRAEQLGLANQVVSKGQSTNAAITLAKEIAQHSLPALSYMKESIQEGLQRSLYEGLHIEAKYFGSVFECEDVTEGTSAFLEKRKPEFSNK